MDLLITLTITDVELDYQYESYLFVKYICTWIWHGINTFAVSYAVDELYFMYSQDQNFVDRTYAAKLFQIKLLTHLLVVSIQIDILYQ